MDLLRKEKEDLSAKLKRIEHEEKMIGHNIGFDDKLALKKLVVMLKIKNDRLKQKITKSGNTIRLTNTNNSKEDNDRIINNLVDKVNKLNEEKENLEK